MNQVHPTESVILKTAAVDTKMVPLVRWLNAFPSVLTLACCQGEPYNEGVEVPPVDRPYVFFLCMDAQDLVRILNAFGLCVDTVVTWDNERRALLYSSRWPSTQLLDDTIRNLPGQ